MRRVLAISSAVALFLSVAADAQVPNFNANGDMVPNQPPLVIQGPITPGDCVTWINSFTIGDSGSPCGSGGGGTACTAGSLDLSLATGCNIPFYVGGVFP